MPQRSGTTIDEPRVDFEKLPEFSEKTPAPAPSERVNGRSPRRHARSALPLLLVAVAAGSYSAWRYYAVRESTDDAQIDGHILPISGRVGGTVARVLVNDNQFVSKGAVLVELDTTDYRIALQKAEADLADARAAASAASTSVPIMRSTTSSQLAHAEAALSGAQKQADAAAAQLREAQAHHNRIAADVQRFASLIARDEISRQQYDTAVATEQAAAAAVDSARAQVAAAHNRVSEAEAGVAAARTAPQQVAVSESRAGAAAANVARQQALLAQARLNLQYTTVVASESGIVSRKSVEPGQVIQPGQPLLALVSLDDLWVTANFKETQLQKMRPGHAATIHVDAYGRDYRGHIDSIGGATGARFSLLPPENASGNYVKVVQRVPVKIVFDQGQDPDHLLRPGLSVVPTVLVGK